jgi:hypothetical protein
MALKIAGHLDTKRTVQIVTRFLLRHCGYRSLDRVGDEVRAADVLPPSHPPAKLYL